MLYWIGIFFCLSQSAIFSGLTIGLFGLSRLKLEVEAEAGDKHAQKVLTLRKNANFLLATLIWGNVSFNVLLTLLTNSVMAGVGAFVFSTVGIAILGELVPQAFFSRHGLRAGAFLVPLIRLYQILLYPIARITAFLLDLWLGHESVGYFDEREFLILLQKHMKSKKSDVGKLEGIGATNFLVLDDVLVNQEGEPIHPESIMSLSDQGGRPIFPVFSNASSDPFLQAINKSQEKWVVFTNLIGEPLLVLDADNFLRSLLYGKASTSPYFFCHRPIVVKSPKTTLGQVIQKLKVRPEHAEDDVVDHDLILYWNDEKRIITGADILGRLLRGIATRTSNFEGLSE
jgi:metal transporter CNNM